jgi:phage host-nuclease inhibitor protein Gam
MVRKRIEGTALQSWADVDTCLADIARTDRELMLIEGAANEKIEEIRKDIKERSQPILEKKAGLELQVKEYCEANRAEFTKTKTKALTFGEVGFRLSTRIMIKRIAETLQALKDLDLKQCISIKEEPDKEAMKALTDETLAEVGASRKTDNTFGYTLNLERINGEAM